MGLFGCGIHRAATSGDPFRLRHRFPPAKPGSDRPRLHSCRLCEVIACLPAGSAQARDGADTDELARGDGADGGIGPCGRVSHFVVTGDDIRDSPVPEVGRFLIEVEDAGFGEPVGLEISADESDRGIDSRQSNRVEFDGGGSRLERLDRGAGLAGREIGFLGHGAGWRHAGVAS